MLPAYQAKKASVGRVILDDDGLHDPGMKMKDFQHDFIDDAIRCRVLRFGRFVLKSGRVSPYFFNTALFDTGSRLSRLGQYYAKAIAHWGIKPDLLYGPAYKGIPLVCATAIAMAEKFDVDLPVTFNRKEIKDHGEGGKLVGAPLSGSVLILDDVVTAGLSVRESVDIIKNVGAKAIGVLIALDRQEQGRNGISATDEIIAEFDFPVYSVVTFSNIIDFLRLNNRYSSELAQIEQYRNQYGTVPGCSDA